MNPLAAGLSSCLVARVVVMCFRIPESVFMLARPSPLEDPAVSIGASPGAGPGDVTIKFTIINYLLKMNCFNCTN